jgi:hypothetical protein
VSESLRALMENRAPRPLERLLWPWLVGGPHGGQPVVYGRELPERACYPAPGEADEYTVYELSAPIAMRGSMKVLHVMHHQGMELDDVADQVWGAMLSASGVGALDRSPQPRRLADVNEPGGRMSWAIAGLRSNRDEVKQAIEAAEETPRQDTDRGRAQVAAAKAAATELVDGLGGENGDVIVNMGGHAESENGSGTNSLSVGVYEASS